MSTQYNRRGERLRRLAYDLEALAADAKHDGLASAANGLNEAANAARYASEAYWEKACAKDRLRMGD